MNTFRITSGFRLPARPDHDGLDGVGRLTSVPVDSDNKPAVLIPVLATEDGTVRTSTIIAKGKDLTWEWGNYVCLVGAYSGLFLYSCHMYQRLVKAGQKVKQGDVVGYMGNSGHSKGAHLHFEVRTAKGAVQNAAVYLGIPNQVGYVGYNNGGGQTQGDDEMPKMKLCRPMNKPLSTDLMMENKDAIAGRFENGEFMAYLSVKALEYENTKDSISRVKDEMKKDARYGDILIRVD